MLRTFMTTAAIMAMAAALSACGGDDKTASNEAPAQPPAPADAAPAAPAQPLVYPETKTVDQVDDYFGTKVADPYRWLERDVREAPDVAAWVKAENAVTHAYLDALPVRDKIAKRMSQLWNFEKFSVPVKRGDRYFYRRNDGVQNQSVLYVQDSLDGAPRVLIDPNPWSEDATTALASFMPSPDGKYVLYAVQKGGSDWRTLKVLDVETGETLPNEIDWVKFTNLAWMKDGSGFFYSRFPQPDASETFQSLNYNQKLYFHRLGDTQAADAVVYARADDPTIGVSGEVTDDGRYLVVTMSKGTDARYEIVVKNLVATDAQPLKLITGFDNDYGLVGSVGDVLYFRTDKDAPKGRIVAIDLNAPEQARWREIVPETNAALTDATMVGGKILAEYLEDVKSVVRIFDKTGASGGTVELPGIGAASGFHGAQDDPETFYDFSGLATPDTIYRLDVSTGESSVFKQPKTPFNPDNYVVTQVFYPSKDGTKIPMFIAHKKGLDLASGAPTLLYGYGGFDISILPEFNIRNLAWMEMGGVYAQANLRGGGEYGQKWHDAGRLLNKQNVFDDFEAAGEYLVSEGYTTKKKLAIYGRSNGGLLVGAVTNQRPDLFACALPQVGVMDMLRFNQFTAGRYWTDDYGDPANEKDFKNLYAYSPYHNIHAGVRYPAILASTADTDDRVVPGHSFKYVARLQATDTGPEPTLIRIDTNSGHAPGGEGKPRAKLIAEYADMWAFCADKTGLTPPDGYGE